MLEWIKVALIVWGITSVIGSIIGAINKRDAKNRRAQALSKCTASVSVEMNGRSAVGVQLRTLIEGQLRSCGAETLQLKGSDLVLASPDGDWKIPAQLLVVIRLEELSEEEYYRRSSRTKPTNYRTDFSYLWVEAEFLGKDARIYGGHADKIRLFPSSESDTLVECAKEIVDKLVEEVKNLPLSQNS